MVGFTAISKDEFDEIVSRLDDTRPFWEMRDGEAFCFVAGGAVRSTKRVLVRVANLDGPNEGCTYEKIVKHATGLRVKHTVWELCWFAECDGTTQVRLTAELLAA